MREATILNLRAETLSVFSFVNGVPVAEVVGIGLA